VFVSIDKAKEGYKVVIDPITLKVIKEQKTKIKIRPKTVLTPS